MICASSYTIERDGQRIDIPIPANFIEEFSEKGSSGNFVTFRFAPIVELVAPKTIAEKVGLKKGDRIVEVNGVPITYKDELDREIRNIKTNSIEFKVSRDGNILPFKEAFNTEKPMIGFQAQRPTALFETVTYGLGESIPLGTERAFSMLFTQVKAFGKLITGKLSVNKSLSGPLGIMDAFDAGWDWVRFWSLTGMLSLVLAFMNLLPIPALDGGHVMFLSYEIISRRKPSDKFLETAQKVGMVFLLALMVFIFANDIIKKIPSSKDKTEKSST